MDIPGLTGAVDPELWEKAEAESKRLLDALKEAVQAEVRDAGVLRKELRVTVPAQIIADHMEHNFHELMHDALVPGFRKGRAPRRLIEKRYGAEVRESLKSSLVGQAFFAATEREKLDVLGDPLFRIDIEGGTKLMGIDEALQHLQLPGTGDFSYVCEVELKPQFELPELKGIPVRRPAIEISDAMIQEQLLQHRRRRGRLEPVTAGAAERDDHLVADVVISAGGQEIKREENVNLAVRPTRIDGIPLLKLDEALAGVRPGEARTVDCTIPSDYERADVRGQAGQIRLQVHELKRLVPEPLADFVSGMGFASEQEAREYYQGELEAERDQLIENAKRGQVEEYLLKNTALELPQDFSSRQTERAVLRQMIELQQRGMAWPDIEARVDELRTSAREQVARALKLEFILDRVAETLSVDVTDEEVNTEIARLARVYNRRFDRVRDDLQARGLLEQLVSQIRHGKCVEQLLAQASVEDVTEPPPAAK